MNSGDAALAARARSRARIRRGMYILPSFFTALNIGAGYFAITQTIDAITNNLNAIGSLTHLDVAAIAILLAIPFDALDGRIARMTNTASDFGRELDSLADVITFGVAPSLLAWVWGFRSLPESMNPDVRQHILQAGSFLCFLFLIGGASRLARFNISHDPKPRNPGRPDRKYFVGMPIPAAAGLLATTVHFFGGYPVTEWWVAISWMGLVGLAGFLMVSTWRFWSGKEIDLSRAHPFRLLLVMAIVMYSMIRFSQVVLFAIALVYMFSGIWARAAYSWSRRRRRGRMQDFQRMRESANPDPDPLHHT
ncbi:MAG TPA: phosphatidylcholine/phosphatidylserine synthase [Terracidiphilus sp.]|nr:phosphatidylcholine/phosphatidylserine synthase [Terracidiphilus sp.]